MIFEVSRHSMRLFYSYIGIQIVQIKETDIYWILISGTGGIGHRILGPASIEEAWTTYENKTYLLYSEIFYEKEEHQEALRKRLLYLNS